MIWNAKSDPGLSEILYANRIFLPALLVLLSDPQSRHMYDRFDVLFFQILLELSIFFPFVHVKTHLYNIFHTFLIFPLFFYKKISVRTNEQRFLYLIYCAVVFLPGSTEFGRFQWKRMDISRSATISAAHNSIHSVFGRKFCR